MDHMPNDCPNKLIIEQNRGEIKELKDMFHSLDKKTSNHQTEITTQYNTLIGLVVQQGNDYKGLANTVGEIKKELYLNEYKTNKTTDLAEKVTWGIVAKVGTLMAIVGTLLITALKGV